MPNSRRFAPITKGMKSKNENFAAFSLSMPRWSAVEIVVPLLEIPGKSARICARPIANDFLEFSFFPALVFFVERRIIPVIKKKIPTARSEPRLFEIRSENKRPKSPAGIVAIIKNNHNFLESLLNFSNSLISFLVKIKTARRDAKCSMAIRKRFSWGRAINFEKSARCPLEEIGRNSVAA